MKPCDEDSTGRLLYLTTQAMTLQAEKALKPYGLTVEQFILLKNISENDTLTQNQLCEIVEKSAANVTRILDRLEKKDLIKRKKNPADRRSILLFLTGQGTEMIEDVGTLFDSFSEHLIRGVSNQELEQFTRTLHSIRTNLDTLFEASSHQ